ncbi:LysR substrate-binding domain-containing protein [Amorphus orientalis]|uniref:DNA-binding transcriptional LysR family regulator n=1 Tax=Amorphus orientalis TaxID=649198 RepID=A0AAE3VRA1_9HYPH|nr:LysR substrate-binding domain-containing protein [Amorphus orientalis]MDQ0316533.1 DNA-binding transcriptional LysR family regulator [Amorphus orientalis]
MRSLDPDVLRTFMVVAEAPSFADAGNRLNKTQSTVSVQMRRLEEILGVELFAKQGRKNVLTSAGKELLDYAVRIVRLNDEAVGRFRRPAISGRIRIGTPDDYAEAYLPEIFGRFARTHPTVEVSLECQSSERLTQLMDAGELDLAIITMTGPTNRARVVHREQLQWVAGDCCEAETQSPLPLAVWQPGCIWRTLTMQALDTAGIPYRIAYSGTNAMALAMAVRQGLAVAAMPMRMAQNGFRQLGCGSGLPVLSSFDIGVMRSDQDNPIVDAFYDHVVASFDELEAAAVAA